ncbi:hypothetical protein AB4Z22_05325, partial [Paenibacillus sp. TAF58]
LYRDLFLACVKQFINAPTLKTDLPSAGKVNLTRQSNGTDYVLHLLYAVPILRGDTQVIEDVLTLKDISIQIKLDDKVKQVMLLPEMATIPHSTNEEGYTSVSVSLTGHQMVLFQTTDNL